MSLNDQLTADMKTAMKERNSGALTVIRALKSSIKNAAIEKGGADAVLEDSEIISVIRKQIKQRQDSITQFESAGRPELAENEKSEMTILETYLPTPLSEDEIKTLVAAAVEKTEASSRADMGKVMAELKVTTEGRADGKVLSQLVMAALS